MLPVSLDCPFFDSPTVFSNVYLPQTAARFHIITRKMKKTPRELQLKNELYLPSVIASFNSLKNVFSFHQKQ
jgi:hypothetical protein